MYICLKWGPGPEVSQGDSVLGYRTFRFRPHSAASTGWLGDEALCPALEPCPSGSYGIPGVHHRSLGIAGLAQVVAVGHLAELVPGRSCDVPVAPLQRPPLHISCSLSSCVVLTTQVRMLVSERYIPAVQFLPTRSLAGVEPHAFRLDPRHDLVQISRPALRPGFLGSTVSVNLEDLQEVNSRHGGQGAAHPGGLDSGRRVTIIVDGHPLSPSRQAPRHLWKRGSSLAYYGDPSTCRRTGVCQLCGHRPDSCHLRRGL